MIARDKELFAEKVLQFGSFGTTYAVLVEEKSRFGFVCRRSASLERLLFPWGFDFIRH